MANLILFGAGDIARLAYYVRGPELRQRYHGGGGYVPQRTVPFPTPSHEVDL